ncbi:Late embryogenesis abundant protein [Forsythia ovata]|uniref:Late embryogenesis abundant protein n=1 Tax=Forsythia ovata TaxID=205694 RepID=A0ABD1PGQ7_9LAMI
MATNEQKFRAGETKGKYEEKTGQAMDSMKNKAQEAKDKASEMAHSAQGRTRESKDQTGSYLSEKAGATKEKTCETAETAKQKVGGAAQDTKEKASQMAESGSETADTGKEKTGGLFQKTGEQIKEMAQGTADAMKHTFGMADTDEDDPNTRREGTPPFWSRFANRTQKQGNKSGVSGNAIREDSCNSLAEDSSISAGTERVSVLSSVEEPPTISASCTKITGFNGFALSDYQTDEARDDGTAASSSGSPWFELQKDAATFVSQTLQRGQE